mmetsp:Transcript_63729/g.194894  ORF Transcript_63729/g.194894 Transcript_63729/m.194894 type:complete len:207 (+) Transcript_63729:667-1287(+)
MLPTVRRMATRCPRISSTPIVSGRRLSATTPPSSHTWISRWGMWSSVCAALAWRRKRWLFSHRTMGRTRRAVTMWGFSILRAACEGTSGVSSRAGRGPLRWLGGQARSRRGGGRPSSGPSGTRGQPWPSWPARRCLAARMASASCPRSSARPRTSASTCSGRGRGPAPAPRATPCASGPGRASCRIARPRRASCGRAPATRCSCTT